MFGLDKVYEGLLHEAVLTGICLAVIGVSSMVVGIFGMWRGHTKNEEGSFAIGMTVACVGMIPFGIGVTRIVAPGLYVVQTIFGCQ